MTRGVPSSLLPPNLLSFLPSPISLCSTRNQKIDGWRVWAHEQSLRMRTDSIFNTFIMQINFRLVPWVWCRIFCCLRHEKRTITSSRLLQASAFFQRRERNVNKAKPHQFPNPTFCNCPSWGVLVCRWGSETDFLLNRVFLLGPAIVRSVVKNCRCGDFIELACCDYDTPGVIRLSLLSHRPTVASPSESRKVDY